VREVLAIQPLHGQETFAIGCSSVRNVCDDPRMPQIGEHVGFPEESVDIGIASAVCVQQL